MDEGRRVFLDAGAKHNSVDHREDADIESQAEREREDYGDGEPWLPRNRAQSVPEILTHAKKDRRPARILQVLDTGAWKSMWANSGWSSPLGGPCRSAHDCVYFAQFVEHPVE